MAYQVINLSEHLEGSDSVSQSGKISSLMKSIGRGALYAIVKIQRKYYYSRLHKNEAVRGTTVNPPTLGTSHIPQFRCWLAFV